MEMPGSMADLLATTVITEVILLLYSEGNMNSAEKLDWKKQNRTGFWLMLHRHLYGRSYSGQEFYYLICFS